MTDVPVYIVVYVDDMLLIYKTAEKINKLKSDLSTEVDMEDLDL